MRKKHEKRNREQTQNTCDFRMLDGRLLRELRIRELPAYMDLAATLANVRRREREVRVKLKAQGYKLRVKEDPSLGGCPTYWVVDEVGLLRSGHPAVLYLADVEAWAAS